MIATLRISDRVVTNLLRTCPAFRRLRLLARSPDLALFVCGHQLAHPWVDLARLFRPLFEAGEIRNLCTSYIKEVVGAEGLTQIFEAFTDRFGRLVIALERV